MYHINNANVSWVILQEMKHKIICFSVCRMKILNYTAFFLVLFNHWLSKIVKQELWIPAFFWNFVILPFNISNFSIHFPSLEMHQDKLVQILMSCPLVMWWICTLYSLSATEMYWSSFVCKNCAQWRGRFRCFQGICPYLSAPISISVISLAVNILE